MNKMLIVVALSSLLPLATIAAETKQTLASEDDTTAGVASPDAVDEAKPSAAVHDPHCLRGTGSRIATRRNAKGERACLPLSGRSYSRDDLQRTGKTDVADALRVLDPSIR